MIEVNKVYNESCLDTMKRMDSESIDCIITSPPYWQLRDYGYPEQWGLEPTFQEYLEHLWQFMDEAYRVLKPKGSAWINLGDTYGGTGAKKAGNYGKITYIEQSEFKGNDAISKCLLLIPHRFAIGCIDRGWIVRNDIVWAKRNGMPESVTDRFSKKHEYFFFMVKQEDYYFDLESIKDTHKSSPAEIRRQKRVDVEQGYANANGSMGHSGGLGYSDNGKNPGSVSDFWDIPTKPSSKEHYASYNDELLKKPIIAGCPEGGVIYDPFMGTGTTALTALRANRNFIGSELGVKYYQDCVSHLDKIMSMKKLF